jgi:histidine kinase
MVSYRFIDRLPGFRKIYANLSFRLVLWVGLMFLVSVTLWAYFSIAFQNEEIGAYGKEIIGLAIVLFLGTALIISIFLMRFVNRPIKKLIADTHRIGRGEYDYKVNVDRPDEIGQLASAIDQMRSMIGEKQEELKKQWHEYQSLFEESPCYITVQDRNLRILRYNREFANTFSPRFGDFCFKAYKGRSVRCEVCPVIKTFEDGKPHYSEEAAVTKDGAENYWMVRTSPIKNSKGEVIAAMEMSLDLTHLRFLEKEAKKSEEKYRTIFNTIPNPVFVLHPETLEILDCNDSVTAVYGFQKQEILKTSFKDLFQDNRDESLSLLKTSGLIERAMHTRKGGQTIYVSIRVSSSEYSGQKVLLVTTSDVTMRLLAEQQLIQSSKMATLGEMATGVAHELNQPLSVIKTASSFIKRKVTRKEPIDPEIMKTMAEEMDSHVDRAERIISHMREFGRKSEVAREQVQVNEVLRRSLDFFKQQLKLREIEVLEQLDEDLPLILADSNRLEQVFINLLINARDAIEKKWEQGKGKEETKKITIRTNLEERIVTIRISDNGTGIPKQVLDKIFEPFFTTKTVGKGTGLGLSISYGIVRDYDGAIRVESREGEGSTFVVKFPPIEEADEEHHRGGR